MYGVKVFEGLVEKIRNNLDLLIENKDWEFRVKDSYNADFSEKLPLGNYELIMPSGVIGEVDTIIASFKLVPMVNCCGICVSTQAFINPQWRHKGLGTFMNSIRLDIARYNGYSLLLCTDIESKIGRASCRERV